MAWKKRCTYCQAEITDTKGTFHAKTGTMKDRNGKDLTEAEEIKKRWQEGYKIKTQKSLAFLYTNNEKKEREIKETIPFTTAMKRIKHLGINLPKEIKDLYIESYYTLVKEINDDTNRWRNIPCS